MKSSKNRGSFCLRILTIYTNDWSTFWHVYRCHVFSFFCEILKYVQTKSRLAHFDWGFMQDCQAGWGWWMQADLVPSNQKFSCKWNLSFFKAVPSNRQPAALGSPLHIASSLFSLLCLFQNVILHKMLGLGFWNFKPIFLRIQFSLVPIFFSLVLVISLSWYFHFTISYLTLWKPNGLSRHLKGHQVIRLDLSTSPKLEVKWIILKSY